MTTAKIREKLHNYLDIVEDKKLKAIYTMMEKDINANAVEYTDELVAALDSRYESYKNGTAKMITKEESEERIDPIRKSKKK